MSGLERLAEAHAVERLRERDASLFTDDVDARIRISQRLGWTDLAHKAPERFPLLERLAETVAAEGTTDVLLLGMGGSSLAPLVMDRVIGTAPGRSSTIGNGLNGIYIDASQTVVGRIDSGNVIAHNAESGIFVFAGTGNTFRGNIIYRNGTMGIDL